MKTSDIGIILITLVSTLIVAIIGGIVIYKSTRREVTLTIDKMWAKSVGDEGQKYLFSDTEGNVYEISDEWRLLLWDASNRWAKMREGKTYRVILYGRRWYWLSWYPNAVEFEEVLGE